MWLILTKYGVASSTHMKDIVPTHYPLSKDKGHTMDFELMTRSLLAQKEENTRKS